jgi:hypothetical protein
MPDRAWLLQANPDRYDIDHALEATGTIDWHLPQHASEVAAGDLAFV